MEEASILCQQLTQGTLDADVHKVHNAQACTSRIQDLNPKPIMIRNFPQPTTSSLSPHDA